MTRYNQLTLMRWVALCVTGFVLGVAVSYAVSGETFTAARFLVKAAIPGAVFWYAGAARGLR